MEQAQFDEILGVFRGFQATVTTDPGNQDLIAAMLTLAYTNSSIIFDLQPEEEDN